MSPVFVVGVDLRLELLVKAISERHKCSGCVCFVGVGFTYKHVMSVPIAGACYVRYSLHSTEGDHRTRT